MNTLELFHGTAGDNILEIIRSGKMRPHRGEIYFSTQQFGTVLQYGPDRKRKATYAIKVRAHIPNQVTLEPLSRPGAPRDAVVLKTQLPIAVEVLELYVRLPRQSTVQTVKGAHSIKKLLTDSAS